MLTLADIDTMYPETHDGSVYSDLYKSVHGFRPRGVTFANLADFERSWEILQEANEREVEEENRQFDAAAEKFKALVLENIDLGAVDRETAIRWIAEAHELDFDGDWKDDLEWELGLRPFYLKG